MIDDLFENLMQGDIDLKKIMMSATHAGKPKGVNADHLSKVWWIDLYTARRTLDTTTQSYTRKDNPTLSCNYGTNDRML